MIMIEDYEIIFEKKVGDGGEMNLTEEEINHMPFTKQYMQVGRIGSLKDNERQSSEIANS